MRTIILDTETTGASARQGDRIVEIGAVEMIDHRPTGRVFHAYLDPKHPIHWAATRVHGLRNADLEGFPVFRDILPEFLDFVGGDRIHAHNAAFDASFVSAEITACGHAPFPGSQWSCTLPLVRRHVGSGSAKLDAVVARLGLEIPDRKIHGALLDAAILAAVVARLHRAPDIDVAALTAAAKPFPGKSLRLLAGESRQRPVGATPARAAPEVDGWRPDPELAAQVRAMNATPPEIDPAKYARLYSGRDAWSVMKGPALTDAAGKAAEIGDHLGLALQAIPQREAESALRWICRGLSPEHAIARQASVMLHYKTPGILGALPAIRAAIEHSADLPLSQDEESPSPWTG